ncbi:LodA/GoxA family CTQ-dependent oxidase [Terriglobus saanensis]|uniref:L-lysine 6-oxidase n=1 Tax=Terriglobus saanensis (strain ATCC BAA-1853 / DSM 23119 / SP1PR4) TaxID=401053 RepID=E8V090_TERSS|nr:LodA/GoxA family CTQ-dependent oxidase [Terriglobus saanensis]ADV83308.1 hypothetical protein AciPR4_2529 [Terriglobus saanensis SP1PR4]
MSDKQSIPIYKIHPGIGIARLGNSPDEFCISPETPASLPIACDAQGNPSVTADGSGPVRIDLFKDIRGRIKRQAARFQVYVYDDASPEGRPLRIGDTIEGGGNRGVLSNIQWRVYLANKKSAWYEFQQLEGEHGYLPGHPLRNADITDPNARQRLIIDAGPQIVDLQGKRRAAFNRYAGDTYATTFPPEDLQPSAIHTLGEILTDNEGRLLVLGGHGYSGSFNTGFGEPRINTYANNDGWFDDTSDGPVHARLFMYSEEVARTRYIDVEYPSWVIAGYPAYVPQVLDMVTLDDVMQDMAVTQFATCTHLYGKAGTFNDPQHIAPSDTGELALWKASDLRWNPTYKPWFYRDIWSILFRADEYTYLTNVLAGSNYPHNQSPRGNFDPDKLSIPPKLNEKSYVRASQSAVEANNSGALFFEAMDAGLDLMDQQAVNSRKEREGFRLMAVVKKASSREELLAALQHFAEVTCGSIPPTEVDPYLAHWKLLYAQSKEAETDPGEAYREARDRLETAIHNFAEELTPPRALVAAENPAASLTATTPPSQQAVSPHRAILTLLDRLSSQFRSGTLLADALARARAENTADPFRAYRTYLYDLLRKTGEENVFRVETKPSSRVHHLPLMPLLSGDNPISNNLPSKFLCLTDFQLYLLKQWGEGNFYNEILEGWVPASEIDPWQPYLNLQAKTGLELDRYVISNLAGGAFCPGAEVGWIMRNPSIYVEPYRIKADPLFSSFRQTAANENQIGVTEVNYSAYIDQPLSQASDYRKGLQPGDLTKMMALPWQADFNECSTQEINVSYELFNQINPDSEQDFWLQRENQVWETLWWPAHRPMQAYEFIPGTESNPAFQIVNWAWGIPQTNAGDLKMVTEWSRLGFLIRNFYIPQAELNVPSPANPKYISVERNTLEKREGESDE